MRPKTCTITNDDIQPKLTLVKTVVNNNGGTLGVSDFPLYVGATQVTSGQTNGFNAGSYTVSETEQTGYSPTGWGGDCAANGTITLLPGDNKTCTITNDDIAPTLKLRKVVVNDSGGTSTPHDWDLTASGTDGFTDKGDSTTFHPVVAGDSYTLSEVGPFGYDASAWNCDGGTLTDGTISLGLAENVTCTITNDDQPAHLIVIKHVINDDGDVAAASDFTMHITGTNVSANDFPGSETGVEVTLNAGTYSADELSNNGYVKTLSGDCSGTIALGQTKTCTITNNDIPHATRTLGFWQTHTIYTTGIFNEFGGTLQIGGHKIDTVDKLFAGFYASISKTSGGAKRSQLDQARMQMLQQWLAAELNCQAFGCGITTKSLLTSSALAWAGTNRNLILSFTSLLDVYNNSNDALPISAQGKATPKDSQTQAASALNFWDTLP